MVRHPRLARFVRAVGVTSVGLRRSGWSGRARCSSPGRPGLRPAHPRPTDVRRTAGLFLPLTAVDAAVVLAGVRARVLRPPAAVLSLAVLGAHAWVARRARR